MVSIQNFELAHLLFLVFLPEYQFVVESNISEWIIYASSISELPRTVVKSQGVMCLSRSLKLKYLGMGQFN